MMMVMSGGDDESRHRALQASGAGQTTTLAGSGTAGFADGTGTNAKFKSPYGVAFSADASIVVVADAKNHRIRLITVKDKKVTTLAGSGKASKNYPYRFADGPGTNAKFYHPYGVAFSADASIVVVGDTWNNRVRLITVKDKKVTTLAGSGYGFADGTGTNAKFKYPRGVAISADSSIVVVADSRNNCVRLITVKDKKVTTLAGSVKYGFADGTGTNAKFDYPCGVAFSADSSIVAVADVYTHRIRMITVKDKKVTTLAGSGKGFADGTGTNAKFNAPSGVAFSADSSIVVVADTSNNRVRMITVKDKKVTTLAGSGTAGFADGTGTNAKFKSPRGVAISADSSIVVVADTSNNRVRMITPPPPPPPPYSGKYVPGSCGEEQLKCLGQKLSVMTTEACACKGCSFEAHHTFAQGGKKDSPCANCSWKDHNIFSTAGEAAQKACK